MAGRIDNPQPSPFIPLEEVDPSKFSFASMVRAEAVTPQILASLVPQKTTYREFSVLPGMDNSRVEEAAGDGKKLGDDWVFSFHQSAETMYRFFFVARRSNVDRQKHIPALSYVTTDRYPWPDVLKSLRFIIDDDHPIVADKKGKVVYLDRYLPRMDLREGGHLPTLVRVKVFVSHQPFPETFFRLDPPVTGSVWWRLAGGESGSVPSCLHPYLEFPETVKNGRVLFGAGTVNEPFNLGQKMIFPATRHKDWRDHVYLEQVQQIRGLYMLEQREAVAPFGRKRLQNV